MRLICIRLADLPIYICVVEKKIQLKMQKGTVQSRSSAHCNIQMLVSYGNPSGNGRARGEQLYRNVIDLSCMRNESTMRDEDFQSIHCGVRSEICKCMHLEYDGEELQKW